MCKQAARCAARSSALAGFARLTTCCDAPHRRRRKRRRRRRRRRTVCARPASRCAAAAARQCSCGRSGRSIRHRAASGRCGGARDRHTGSAPGGGPPARARGDMRCSARGGGAPRRADGCARRPSCRATRFQICTRWRMRADASRAAAARRLRRVLAAQRARDAAARAATRRILGAFAYCPSPVLRAACLTLRAARALRSRHRRAHFGGARARVPCGRHRRRCAGA